MKTVINTAYKTLTNFTEKIPFIFPTKGKCIYKARNELKIFHVCGLDVVVKSFQRPNIIKRIIYTFFRSSKAERSYKHALILLDNGISTPPPIAYIEKKSNGLLINSYYISIYEKDYSEIRSQMLGENASDTFIQSLAMFIAVLHQKGILQKDLSPGNILSKQNGEHYEFMLVDINRTKFLKQMSARQRYKNFERISENKTVICRLAAEYALAMHEDKDKVCREIEKYVACFSRNYRL